MYSRVFRVNQTVFDNVVINNCIFSLINTGLFSVLDIFKGKTTLENSIFHNCRTAGRSSAIIGIRNNADIEINTTKFDLPEHPFSTIIFENQGTNIKYSNFKLMGKQEISFVGQINFDNANISNFQGQYFVLTNKNDIVYFKNSYLSFVTATKLCFNASAQIEKSIIHKTSILYNNTITFYHCYLPKSQEMYLLGEDNIFYNHTKDIPSDFFPEIINYPTIQDNIFLFEQASVKQLKYSDADKITIKNCLFRNIADFSVVIYYPVNYFELIKCNFDGCSGIAKVINGFTSIRMCYICCRNSASTEGFFEAMSLNVETNNTEITNGAFTLHDYGLSVIDATQLDYFFMKYINISHSSSVAQRMIKICANDLILAQSSYFFNLTLEVDYLIFLDSVNVSAEDVLFLNISTIGLYGAVNNLQIIRNYIFNVQAQKLFSFFVSNFKLGVIDCYVDKELKISNSTGFSIRKAFVPDFVNSISNLCFVVNSRNFLTWIYLGTGISVIILCIICTFFIIKCARDRKLMKDRMFLSSLVVNDFG